MSADVLYMRRCLQLAEKGLGKTRSNPLVGSVLVYDGRIIGEGYHACYGEAHAEVNCLNSVKESDRCFIPESTLYVNLEPCAHYGKTPPCASRIVEEGIPRVRIANIDPFAEVAGKGIQILEAAGIEVETGILEEEGRWLNRRFFTHCRKQRPYVILKWAETKDGFMAPADRSRMQLSNEASQYLSHRWRTEEMAIMVAYTTALKDNPRLTARKADGIQPLRIVIDRHLQLPLSSHLLNDAANTWVLNEQREELAGHVYYLKMDFSQSILPNLMRKLAGVGIVSLIVEGGRILLNSFIEADLWDEARIFTTDISLGEGLPAPVLPDSSTVCDQPVLDNNFVLKRSGMSQFV